MRTGPVPAPFYPSSFWQLFQAYHPTPAGHAATSELQRERIINQGHTSNRCFLRLCCVTQQSTPVGLLHPMLCQHA